MATSLNSLPPVNLARLVNPIEPQREFLEKISVYDYVLYEGEGGAGKSYILRWWLVLFLVACFQRLKLRNVRVGLFCEDYPSLEDRQISKMHAEFPPGLGTFKFDRTLDFVLRDEYGGGRLALRNLDKPAKYKSTEFAAIGVDELTQNPLSVFNDLRWRLRWPGLDRPKFGAATNPGGIGHQWVKKYWIERNLPAELQSKRDQFVRVTAKTKHNRHLSPNYHESLLTLPPEMARRVAHGDWDMPAGQYFPYFNPKIHVIPHAEALARIQPFWKRSLSGDWGYGHPHCFHWHAKDEHNCVITFDELWDRRVHESEVGKRITAKEGQYGKFGPLNGFAFAWDAGKLSPRSLRKEPKSTEKLIREQLGPRIPDPHPNDSSPGVRLIRARLMSQLLGDPGDPERKIPPLPPSWFISDRCQKLIEAIPEMMQDEDDPEEMAKIDYTEAQIGDDPVDSAGVGLQWMVGTSRKTRAIMLQERLQGVRLEFLGKAPAQPVRDDKGEVVTVKSLIEKLGGKAYS